MPKRRQPRRIPTPVWERPKGRVRRELGGRIYLVAAFVGLVVLAGLVIAFAFVKDYLDERALPGSTAIAVEDRNYDLDYFAARLRLLGGQLGGTEQQLFIVDAVVSQLIEEETALRFASELDVSVTSKEVKAELASRLDVGADDPGFDDSLEAELESTGFSDEEYRRMVRAQLLVGKVREKLGADIPAEAEQVRYRQIQVATEEEAQQVLARLQDGEKFAALARELSIDPQSKDEGGDRGWLAKGAADRALEETLFALEPGVISDPFPDASGVLVLQVQEKAVRPLNDDQRQQVQGQNFQRWLDEKRQSLKIDNFVSPDSDKLDEERLQWVLDHGRSVITQPVTPTASP